MGFMLSKEVILRKGVRAMVRKLTVVLQGHEGGVPILTRGGIGGQGRCSGGDGPSRVWTGGLGIVQEKSVTAEAHPGPERGQQPQGRDQET